MTSAVCQNLSIEQLRTLIRDLAQSITGRPLLVAIDGRGASGKSTLTNLLCADQPTWDAVHTDDIAWWHSFFAWTDLAVTGILEPARAGLPVSFRPPAWAERDRPGAIEVSSHCEVLIFEGTGTSRRELTNFLDLAIWVDTEDDVIAQRETDRVRSGEVSGALQDEWQAQERPFLTLDEPWTRADLIVNGTTINSDRVLVTHPPYQGRSPR